MDLLQRCLAGEARAWEEWIGRFGPVIHRSVARAMRRYTGSAPGDDTSDATQEVLLRLLRDDCRLLRTYDPSRARLETWLAVVSHSTTVDLLRRRRLKLVALEEEMLERPAPAPDSVFTVPPGLLSPRQELVLKLLFDRDLDVAEAAAVLGVDEQTVRSTKHKALTALRRHFGVGEG